AEGAVAFDPAQRIITPFFIGLAERRHCQLHAMKKITSAARPKFSFPGPVDVHSERGDEQKDENDERQAVFQGIEPNPHFFASPRKICRRDRYFAGSSWDCTALRT